MNQAQAQAKLAPTNLSDDEYNRTWEGLSQYQYLRKSQDPRFGEIQIYKKKNGNDFIFAKEKLTSNKQAAANDIRELKSRIALNGPNLQKMLGYSTSIKKELCSTNYLTQGFYEFPKSDLGKEISTRTQLGVGLPESELGAIASQSLNGLQYLHGKGIAHGDIRPQFLGYNKDVKEAQILDRLADPSPLEKSQANYIVNRKNQYMCPELYKKLQGKDKLIKYDPYKNDVYGLGLSVLEAGNGQSVQDIYNTNGTINQANLDKHVANFGQKYQSGYLNRFVQSAVAADEFSRPSSQDLGAKLGRWDETNVNQTFSQNVNQNIVTQAVVPSQTTTTTTTTTNYGGNQLETNKLAQNTSASTEEWAHSYVAPSQKNTQVDNSNALSFMKNTNTNNAYLVENQNVQADFGSRNKNTQVNQNSSTLNQTYSQPSINTSYQPVNQTVVTSQSTKNVLPVESQYVYTPQTTTYNTQPVYSSQQVIYAPQPTTYVTQPTTYVTQPTTYVSQPTTYSTIVKQPTTYVTAPQTVYTSNYQKPVTTYATENYVTSPVVTYESNETYTPKYAQSQISSVPTNINTVNYVSSQAPAKSFVTSQPVITTYAQPTTIVNHVPSTYHSTQNIVTSQQTTNYVPDVAYTQPTHSRTETRKSVSFINHDESNKNYNNIIDANVFLNNERTVQTISQVPTTVTTTTYTNSSTQPIITNSQKNVISYEEFQNIKRNDPNVILKEDIEHAHSYTAPVESTKSYTVHQTETFADNKNLSSYLQTGSNRNHSTVVQFTNADLTSHSPQKHVQSIPINTDHTYETVNYGKSHDHYETEAYHYVEEPKHTSYANYQEEHHVYSQPEASYTYAHEQPEHHHTEYQTGLGKQTVNYQPTSSYVQTQDSYTTEGTKVRRYRIQDGKSIEITGTSADYMKYY